MEFGSNNIKRSVDKIIVADIPKSNLTASNVDTTGEPEINPGSEERIPLIVIDNDGNIVTEY